MTPETTDLSTQIKGLIDACESSSELQAAKRRRAIDYYNGVMADVPSEEGRSSLVTREVRSTIKKIMPALRRVLFGSTKLCEFLPVQEADEVSCHMASLYVNRVIVPEARVEDAVYDAVHSACLLDEGVITWWHQTKQKISVTWHSGVTQEEIDVLKQEAEVLEQSEPYEEIIADAPVTLFRARVKRVTDESRVCVAAVPLEDFGIHPDATSVEDAPIIYTKHRYRRSELIAMGYDAEVVNGLSEDIDSVRDDDDVIPRDLENITAQDRSRETDAALDLVEIYRCFATLDLDGDGIAELREIHYADSGEILFNDYASEARIAVLVIERVPHSPRGVSIFDDVFDLQRLNTVLTRQGLDNLYSHNNPQPQYQDAAVVNPSSVTSPHFGEPIRLKNGAQPVVWNTVPFVADKAAAMVDRAKQEIVDRTGVSSASSALDPNALQDVREQAVNMISDAAAAQSWCMVRELAQGGLRRVFRGILRLVIEHQDKPRLVRLDDEWHSFDPRSWNADMDCVVNVGLGTGTRERDMAATQYIASLQERVFSGLGPNNPFVGADELYNTLDESVKAAGLTTTSKFFKKPPEGAPLAQPGPNPEQVKIQAQMQLKHAEMQFKAHIEEVQAAADQKVAQYQAQIEAQLEEYRARLAAVEGDADRSLKKYEIDQKMRIEREKIHADMIKNAPHGSADVPTVDPETGETGPSLLMQAIMQQTEMMRGLHAALSAPKKVQFIQDETGRNVGGVVAPDFGMVN